MLFPNEVLLQLNPGIQKIKRNQSWHASLVAKKIKCSSDRPACSNCLRLNILCEYPAIRNRGSRFGYMEMLNRRLNHLEKYINCSTNPDYHPQFVKIHQKIKTLSLNLATTLKNLYKTTNLSIKYPPPYLQKHIRANFATRTKCSPDASSFSNTSSKRYHDCR